MSIVLFPELLQLLFSQYSIIEAASPITKDAYITDTDYVYKNALIFDVHWVLK